MCDQGIGIEKADIPRIFDPFYRGRRGDMENVKGTGLGLALVKAAARGRMAAWWTCPVRRDVRQPFYTAAPDSGTNMSARILIVDDEPSIVMAVKDELIFEGFEVHSAADGPGAVAKARELRP